MATYFGEILEPGTRALLEELSDEEEDKIQTQLQFSWLHSDAQTRSDFNVLFVIHGRLSLAFIEAYVTEGDLSPVAEINVAYCGNDDSEVIGERSKTLPSRVYLLNDSILVCLVSPSYTAELGFEFVKTILPLLNNSRKVVVITNESVHNLKVPSLNELPPAFMRELKTSFNRAKNVVEPLPIPNIITGIPAAVVSWCQIFKKDARIYICYTDQERLDSVTASPYVSLLSKLNYKSLIKTENPDLSKKWFYGNPQVIGGSSNIYI